MINDSKTEFLIITSSFLKQSFDDLNIMVGDSNIYIYLFIIIIILTSPLVLPSQSFIPLIYQG